MELKRYSSLDGLRGLCALYVVFYHVAVSSKHFSELHPAFRIFAEIGNFSVQVFFCLSGFLVYRSYQLLKEKTVFVKRNFYIRRALRILPLWWLLLAINFFIKESISAEVMIANMFFYFGNLSTQSPYLPIVVSWSLLAEEVFYLFLPIFAVWLSPRNTLLALISFMALSGFLQTWGIAHLPEGFDTNFIFRNPLWHFKYFFLGIFLYQLVYKYDLIAKLELFVKWVGSFWFDAVTIFLFFIAPQVGLSLPMEFSVFVLVLNVLSGKTGLSKLVSTPIFQKAGIYCYGIYLLQGEATYLVNKGLYGQYNLDPYIEILVTYGANLAVLLPLAITAYHLVEKPFLNLKKAVGTGGNLETQKS